MVCSLYFTFLFFRRNYPHVRMVCLCHPVGVERGTGQLCPSHGVLPEGFRRVSRRDAAALGRRSFPFLPSVPVSVHMPFCVLMSAVRASPSRHLNASDYTFIFDPAASWLRLCGRLRPPSVLRLRYVLRSVLIISVLRKVSFRLVKGVLLACDSLPFMTRKVTFWEAVGKSRAGGMSSRLA